MKENFNFSKGLKIKEGGNMFKKVLSGLVVCSFMVSNVCFAMPVAIPVLDSTVKSIVDNIAIESALAGNNLNPAQLQKITDLFMALTGDKSEEIKSMWAQVLDPDNPMTAQDALEELKASTQSDQVVRVVFENGKAGFIFENNEGQIELSAENPLDSSNVGNVAKFELTEQQKTNLSEAEVKAAELLGKNDMITRRWKAGSELTADEKQEKGNSFKSYITQNTRINYALSAVSAVSDKNITVEGVLEMYNKMSIKMSDTFADANGNYSLGYGNGIAGQERMLLPNGMTNYDDIILHEVLEAMGLSHEQILPIQEAVSNQDGNGKFEQTTQDIRGLRDEAIANAKANAGKPEVQLLDKVGEKIQSTKEFNAGKSPDVVADEILVASMNEIVPTTEHTLKQLKNIGLAEIKKNIFSADDGLLNTVIALIGSKDMEKALAVIELISALGNPNAEIPMIESDMFIKLVEGEVTLTNFAVPIIAALKGAKLKDNAVIHVFSAGANALEKQNLVNTMVGAEAKIFKFHEGDESTAGITGAAITQTHVIYTSPTKEHILDGANYHLINGDINKLNGLTLFSVILQGKKTDEINRVLADIAAGEFEMLPPEFILSDEMRFKVEVVKAILEQA